MKFFFPDAHELVDPNYNFARKHDPPRGVGQQDGKYAHELIDPPPYDGILLSRGVIQGRGSDADGRFGDAKYKLSEQQRLYRVGAREFFRAGKRPLLFMGDCGAFSYRNEPEPPYTVDGVIGYYDACRVDWGVSVDHVILGYDARLDKEGLFGTAEVPEDWVKRQEITITLAAEFLRKSRTGRHTFEPVGAAQGWSPKSYAHCVAELQKMGFRRIALGGMVALKSAEVLDVLAGIATVKRPETQLHLLGLNRMDHVAAFRKFGVTSIDSTSPLTQSFKDDRDNYYAPGRTYSAVRIRIADPKVTRELRQLMAAGKLTQTEALRWKTRHGRRCSATPNDGCRLRTPWRRSCGTRSRSTPTPAMRHDIAKPWLIVRGRSAVAPSVKRSASTALSFAVPNATAAAVSTICTSLTVSCSKRSLQRFNPHEQAQQTSDSARTV
ncbi:MAG: tRNA-guanine transglycosylase DpdA [Gemmataceae bacterium]